MPLLRWMTKARRKLRVDLDELWASHNEATDGSTRVHAEYLQVVATRIAGFCAVYFGDQTGEQARRPTDIDAARGVGTRIPSPE